MSKTLTYLLTRAALFIGVMLVVSVLYEHWWWPAEVAKEAPLLHELKEKAYTNDVLYMAESSNITYADTDSLKLKISELMAFYLPGVAINSINQPAGHAGNYLALLQNLPDDHKLKALVVTMNLRSFDAAWIHSELENNLNRINVFYEPLPPLFKKLKLNFGMYPKKDNRERDKDREYQWTHDTLRFPFPHPYATVRAWDNFMANGYYKNADSSWNMDKIALACHYIKGYAFQIDTLTNPRIKDFDALVNLAAQKKVKLVLNLMAENIAYADSLVGYPLVYLMKQNRDLLVNRYTSRGAVVVDNLELIPGPLFIDQNWTTEHYFYEGRDLIARNTSLHLKKVLEQPNFVK